MFSWKALKSIWQKRGLQEGQYSWTSVSYMTGIKLDDNQNVRLSSAYLKDTCLEVKPLEKYILMD